MHCTQKWDKWDPTNNLLLPTPKWPSTPGIEYINFSNLTVSCDKQVECCFPDNDCARGQDTPKSQQSYSGTNWGFNLFPQSLGRSRLNKISGIILNLIKIHTRGGRAEIYTCVMCRMCVLDLEVPAPKWLNTLQPVTAMLQTHWVISDTQKS